MEHIGVFRGSSAMGCESADRLLSSTSARSAVGMGIPMGMGMRWIWGWKFRPHGSADFRRRRLPIHGPHTMR